MNFRKFARTVAVIILVVAGSVWAFSAVRQQEPTSPQPTHQKVEPAPAATTRPTPLPTPTPHPETTLSRICDMVDGEYMGYPFECIGIEDYGGHIAIFLLMPKGAPQELTEPITEAATRAAYEAVFSLPQEQRPKLITTALVTLEPVIAEDGSVVKVYWVWAAMTARTKNVAAYLLGQEDWNFNWLRRNSVVRPVRLPIADVRLVQYSSHVKKD